jgi:hypothetical protein
MYAKLSFSGIIPHLEKVDAPIVGSNIYEACIGIGQMIDCNLDIKVFHKLCERVSEPKDVCILHHDSRH